LSAHRPQAATMSDGLLQLSFRQRLSDLASEHEQLQVRCENLAAENVHIRERLLKLEAIPPEEEATPARQPSDNEKTRPTMPNDPVVHGEIAPQPEAPQAATSTDGFSCLEERAENLLAFLKTQPADQSRERREEIEDQEDGDDLSYESSSVASWGDERASHDGGGSCCSNSRSRSSLQARRHSSCNLQPSARTRRSHSKPRSTSCRRGSSRRRHRDIVVLTSPRAPCSAKSWKRSRSRTMAAETTTQYSRSDDRKRSGRANADACERKRSKPGQQLMPDEGEPTEVH